MTSKVEQSLIEQGSVTSPEEVQMLGSPCSAVKILTEEGFVFLSKAEQLVICWLHPESRSQVEQEEVLGRESIQKLIAFEEGEET